MTTTFASSSSNALSAATAFSLGAFRKLVSLRLRWLLALAALVIVAAIVATTLVRARAGAQYVTAPVVQQTLVQNVTASGTVNPQNNVSVGTQVSGTISAIYVDYNSKVKKGEVLARLDPSTFQAQLDQAKAQLAQAQAQAVAAGATANGAASGIDVAGANSAAQSALIGSAQATIVKTQAALTLAQKTAGRDSALYSQGYIAASTVDTDRANVAQDQSDVASAQATLAQTQAQAQAGAATVAQSGSTAAAQAASAQAAQAAVGSAEAIVQENEITMQHSVITSPVDGTVVARDVSVGQTVAASLQTPTLFAIAQDLGKMEVDINVGEPDIGNVKSGDPVAFSVLAYPNQTFQGTVSQVRINPQTVNNVVTYDVVVLVNNAAGKLLPGMTANATVDIASAPNALVVPTAALAWKPAFTKSAGGAAQSPWGAVTGTSAATAPSAGATGTIFVQRGNKLVRIPVDVTLTTSTQAAVTPIAPATLSAGDNVVVAASGPAHAARAASGGPASPMGANPAAATRGIH